MDVRLSYFLTCSKGLTIYFYPYKKVLAHFNNTKCIKYNYIYIYIRLSEKFLSFHKVIMDEQQFMFYIIL